MLVVRTDDEPVVALLLLTALDTVPESAKRTRPAIPRSNLIEAMVASTSDPVEPTVLRTSGHRWLHNLADAVVHQVSTLTHTSDSVPIGVGGAVGNELAGAHDELTSRDADTLLLELVVNRVDPANRHSESYALAHVVPAES